MGGPPSESGHSSRLNGRASAEASEGEDRLDHKKYTDANRKAWDLVTPRHQAAKAGRFFEAFKQPGYSCLDDTVTGKLIQIGLGGKRVIQVACNDGREALSLKNLGAREVIGVDISAAAIAEAEKLSAASGVDAQFICSDIYDLDTEAIPPCDLCYLSIGVFGWLPDLPRFFKIIASLLKPKGELLIYELHPFIEMFVPGKANPELRIEHSYFKEEPYADELGLDYWGNTEYQGVMNYWFVYKLSDIFMGLIGAGFQIIEFAESPHDTSMEHSSLQKDDVKVPLSMIIHARKS